MTGSLWEDRSWCGLGSRKGGTAPGLGVQAYSIRSGTVGGQCPYKEQAS